jgi:platelet-activating factor acetylhydrolase IB subunit alpha
MSYLSDAQRRDLHLAILQYFTASFPDLVEAFAAASGVGEDKMPSTEALLERKWASLFRLQKKNGELEAKISQLEEEIRGRKEVKVDAVPRRGTDRLLVGHRTPVLAIAFHPVYGITVTCSEDGVAIVWDIDDGCKLDKQLRQHTGAVNDAAFDPTGVWLATASSDLSIKVWNFEQAEVSKTLQGHEHTVSSVRWIDSDQLVSCSRDTTVKIWERSTGFCVQTFRSHESWVRAIALNGAGLLASADNGRRIHVHALGTGARLHELIGHSNVIETLEFGPPALCEIASSAGLLRNETDLHRSGPNAGAWLLVSGARDNQVRVWDALAGVCMITLRGHDNWVRSVGCKGKYVYSCSDDKSVRVWDISTGRAVHSITEAHSHFVACLALHPKLPWFGSGSVDTTVKVWDCK